MIREFKVSIAFLLSAAPKHVCSEVSSFNISVVGVHVFLYLDLDGIHGAVMPSIKIGQVMHSCFAFL